MVLPESVDTIVIHNMEIDLRSAFRKQRFGGNLKVLRFNNPTKKKFTFENKEVDVVSGLIPNLEELSFDQCTISDETLKIMLSHLRELRKLSLLNCKGFSNQLIFNLCK